MTKDVIDAIKERRSIRRYKRDPIPEATIGRLVEAARSAPSAGNIQPWRFTVVLNDNVRRKLAQAAENQDFIAEAPACVVVSAEPGKSASRYGERGETLYCLQDTAAAAQNMILAADAFGLGSCWVGAFDEEMVKASLGLPDTCRPVALLPVGYPAEEGAINALRAQEEVTEIIR